MEFILKHCLALKDGDYWRGYWRGHTVAFRSLSILSSSEMNSGLRCSIEFAAVGWFSLVYEMSLRCCCDAGKMPVGCWPSDACIKCTSSYDANKRAISIARTSAD